LPHVPKVEAEFGSAANSYEILAKLATGGMAEIFLARGNSTAGVERYVVLKRILRHRAHDQAFVRMFLDEARLAAQLQHPNIAQVYDIGKLGDSYFFTMEYVHGETVRLLLQRSHALRSPIPISSVLVVAAGTAAGLHHAHERIGLDGKPLGIVHRDVSPSNLMVSYEGNVKVVDFGVAKAAHRSQETRSGTVKGKISYLSPEQCRGASMDRRSDLFSVGIVLWEMLTLERLYKRNSDFDAMAAIVSEETPPPSSRRPEISPELDALVLRLLAKDPDDRYQTADELHEAIETIAVRLNTTLSSAALARYVRDLFGQRPEPWVEMQSRETHPEVFTVTSEPVPADLQVRPADALESQLGAVPDLSDDAVSTSASSNDAFAKVPSSAPFQSDSDSSRGERPAWQPPVVQPQPPSPRTHGATGPQVPQTYPVPGSGGYPQIVRDPSGAHVAPPPSYSNASYPLYVPPPEPPEDKKGLPRPVIIAIAGAVTILIVVLAVLAGGSKARPRSAATTADAAQVAVVTVDAAAVVPVATQPDAATARPDAAVAVEAPPDAAVVAAHEDSPADQLENQFDRAHYGEAVAICAAHPSLATLASCAIAACRAKDATHARKWYAVGGSKKAVAAACKSAGISVVVEPTVPAVKEPPPPDKKKDCDVDPMACQH